MINIHFLTPHIFKCLIAFFLIASVFSSCTDKTSQDAPTNNLINETHLDYFIKSLIKETNATVSTTDALEPENSVDGFVLRKAFSKLSPQDFIGVEGLQGNYAVHKGELSFTGNAASNSAVLTRQGFKRLLQNCSQRLQIPINSQRDIATILSQLRSNDMTPRTGEDSAAFLMDAVYKKYIPANLEAYMIKTYPQWSIPGRYRWHPKLFDKYRTEKTVAPIIQGDFDCNGTRDYAVLMDKRKKGLAVILFLGNGQSFSSQILSQNLVHDVPKIEYALSIVKPGTYKTIDPDREGNTKLVRLQCLSIGIGLFSELYDGSRDVYFFLDGELRSCLIEN